MNSNEMKKLIFKLFEMWNRGEVARLEEVYTTDFICHYPHVDVNGISKLADMIRLFRQAFPDYHEDIKDMVFGEDKIVVRFVCTGTHQGVFQGIAPSGNKIEFEEISIFRVDNGKIAEQWGVFDSFKMMQQLKI